MATDSDNPGEPIKRGEGAEGFPHGSKYPIFVGGGMFFTALGLLWLPMFIIGIPVLLYGIQGWTREWTIKEYETGVIPQQKRQRLGVSTGYLSMILVIIGELLIFAAVFIAYLYLETESGPFPPEASPEPSLLFGGLLFLVLLIGSITINRGKEAIRRNDRSKLTTMASVTFLSGVAFMVIIGYEYFRLWSNGLHWDVFYVPSEVAVYGSVFFLTTGLHAVHVVAGLALVGWLIYRAAKRNHFSANRHQLVATSEAYWHFLTLIQLLIVIVLYL